MIAYGIDPGITGAIAVVVNGRLEDVADMPAYQVGSGVVRRQVDGAGLAAVIREWRVRFGVDSECAVVERVASRPGQGVASAFSLGHSTGAAHGVLAALGVPWAEASPQIWKRAYGLGRDKADSQATASRLFPGLAGRWTLVKHHNRAEAALLAAYAYRSRA